MAELYRWSGNDTSKYSLNGHIFDEIISFAKKYTKLYLFGAGKIGKGMRIFLEDSGFFVCDNLTSDRMDKVKEACKDQEAGLIVSLGNQFFPEVLPVIYEHFNKENVFIPSDISRYYIGEFYSIEDIKKNFWINIYVTNKCNLMCKSCSAFAPICEPDFYEFEQFKKDIQRIKEMNFEKIKAFEFTGAEAILHPDILKMLSYTRELFPDNKLQLYSNGIYFKTCDNQVLKELARLKVVVTVTEYPLPNLDLQEIYKRFDEYGVLYYVIFSEGQKYFSKRPLNFNKDTEKHNYINCPRYNTFKSLFLFRGRLYKCIYAISAGYVSKAFKKEVIATDKDSIDIYTHSCEDVFEFDIHRIPFCGYCGSIEELVPWELSQKKIEEWT